MTWLSHWYLDGDGCRFSSCYDARSTRDEIFENEAEPMIEEVFAGLVRVPLSYLFGSPSGRP